MNEWRVALIVQAFNFQAGDHPRPKLTSVCMRKSNQFHCMVQNSCLGWKQPRYKTRGFILFAPEMIFPLVPINSSSYSRDTLFHSLQKLLNEELQPLLLVFSLLLSEMGANKSHRDILSMKTPSVTSCDRQSPRPDSLQTQSMGTMCTNLKLL